jgi:RNA polymerase sigma-54 factor
MLKQNLNLKLTQKLSPQQIQLMKLLQIPTASLEQRIKEELEANPALEEGEDRDENELRTEDVSDEYYGEDEEGYYGDNDHEEVEPKREEEYELDDYISDYIDDDPSSYKLRTEGNTDEEDKSVPVASESSFHDFLEQQLGLLNFNDPRR